MSRAAPRVGFVRMGPHPIPNRLLPDALASALGGARIEILDLDERMRRDPIAWLINPFFVVWEHGWNLLRGRVSPWRAFFTTTFLFRRMSRLARRWVERTGVETSFQIQSLFDARSPETPHFVYTDHTHLANLDYRDFDRRTLLGRRWLELERRLYRGAETVFTRSRNISVSVVESYGCDAGRVLCVGAGSNVPIDADDAVRESRVSARPAAPELLFVGNDWKRKGGPDLVEAFRRLREKTPDLRLTIVGCRPDVDLPGVRALGNVSLEEVRDAYVAASIFCLPTHREPFGVAILEAMHHGLPVVSTRVGAVPEMVGDSGCGELVDVGDVDDLTRAIEGLLAEPERAHAMGERGRRRARERFTWAAVSARMAAAMGPFLVGMATRGDATAAHETAGADALPLRSEFAG
jgi:glycosyltransferase involved in cell wall biosynthesis